MAGTVESSIVLNAVDNTKSALNSVQSNLEKLVHEAVKMQSSFSKIDTSGLEGFKKAIAENQNKVGELRSKLADCEKGTYEYIKTTNQLNKALREGEILWKEHDEAIRKENEALNQDYIASKNQTQAEEQLTTAVQKNNNAILENIKNFFSHKSEAQKNAEAIKMWEERIKALEDSIIKQNAVLAESIKKYGETSPQVQKVQENLRELDNELKENKKHLKEATANVSPFMLALQKLGKNIKSLFLLHAAKEFLNVIRKGFKWAVNEMIEGGLKLEQVAGNFDHLAEVGGMDAIKLRNALREASHNMVSDVDLMQSTSKAMLLGVGGNVENLANLMKIAEVRGAQMGESTTKAFDDVVLGIGRLSPKILDNLGIIVSLQDAYETYAQKVGKATDELTKQEQQIALTEEVLRQSQQQLLDWENKNLSVQEKLTQIQTRLKNALAQVGASFMSWLTPVIDKVSELSARTYKMSDDVTKDIQAKSNKIPKIIARAIEEIWDITETLVSNTWDIFKDLFTTIGEGLNGVGMLYSAVCDAIGTTNSDTITGMAGDWTDIFYFINLGIAGIAMAFKIAFKGVVGVIKATAGSIGAFVGRMTGSFDNAMVAIGYGFVKMAQSALDSVVQMVNKMVDWLNRIPEKLGLGKMIEGEVKGINIAKLLGIDDASMNAAKNIRDDFIGDIEAPRKDLWSDLNQEADEGVEQMMKIFEKQVAKNEKAKYEIDKKNSPRQILRQDEDEDLGGGGGGSKSKTKDDLEDLKKEMQEYAKETERLKKEKDKWLKSLDDFARDKLKDQAKLIDDLGDEYEKKFNEIQKNIDNTEKAIEKLNEQIDELKKKMNDLKVEENKSIANEVVKARKELKGLEEQYEGLKEVAESVSMGDLEGKGGIGKFDVDLIKKYKSYQEELDGLYTGMSASEQEALNKEIEYAEWYDSLNGIEKIKEDYRIRQEEIQNELNEKLNALSVEQATLRQYKKEQQKLQDEWIKRIDEETAKYNDMYEKIKVFEAKYMERIETDHWKQIRMTEQLIDQWNAVYRAKMRALSAGSGDGERAIGGSVSKGKTYLVGEMGPELFVPSTNGRIVNNSDLNKGDGGIEITVNMGGVSVGSDIEVDEMAKRVSDIILRDIQLYKKGIR